MIDIALDDQRVLRGRFVDSAGEPIDGAVVTLRQADRVIARSTTLRNGTFEIERVPSGAYRLSCGSASGQVRCWTSDAAPPHAVIDGVTFQDNVVRGQAVVLAPALLGSTALTSAAASGAAIGGVATYAALDSSSKTPPTTDQPSQSIPINTQQPPPGLEVVGRDGDGNLIRTRVAAPWHDGFRDSINPPPDSGTALDDQFSPASP
jgi:hypothetical protein